MTQQKPELTKHAAFFNQYLNNQEQNQNHVTWLTRIRPFSRVCHGLPFFPRLAPISFLLRILIGSLRYSRLLWLVRWDLRELESEEIIHSLFNSETILMAFDLYLFVWSSVVWWYYMQGNFVSANDDSFILDFSS